VITLKSPAEIEKMRKAGRVVAEVLEAMRDKVAPGVTTAELDEMAREIIARRGATPSFLGYPPGSAHPFPAAVCSSVNEELVHGVPGERVLRDGDIVSIDVGAILDGYHGDAAVTLPVGEIDVEARRIVAAAEGALAAGISPPLSSRMPRPGDTTSFGSIPGMASAARCTRTRRCRTTARGARE
jgi:methionyl aminopeptidase